MALTYAESAALMKDAAFIDRVKVACLKYADFILNEAPNTPGHSSRYRWAQQTTSNPDSAAQMTTPPTVMDSAVQNAGLDTEGTSAITDAALQSSVETVINRLL
jgi:hypothetical protein